MNCPRLFGRCSLALALLAAELIFAGSAAAQSRKSSEKTSQPKPSARAAQGTSTVTVDPAAVYYTLPKHVWGMKFGEYNWNYVNNTTTRSADGKTYSDLLLEMNMDWLKCGFYYRDPGTPEAPLGPFAGWKKIADQIVDRGGVYFPELFIGPKTLPTGNKTLPEVVDNINTGGWSPQNVKAWYDYFAKTKGVNKLRGYEPYNEPGCMNDTQVGASGHLWWYSFKDFPTRNPKTNTDDWSHNAASRCEDWATVHTRQVNDLLSAAYPNLVTCGGSYSAPASDYGVNRLSRFILGYDGWPWKDNNTKHIKALSLHSYGYSEGGNGDTPSAPDGGQSAINSYFYPVYKNPGKVSGYKAAVDQLRKVLDDNGGQAVKIADTEWCALAPVRFDGINGARSALGDIIGAIVHCQNAAAWKFDSICYHAAEPYPVKSDLTKWDLPGEHFCNSLIGIANNKLYRTQRYYVIKDIAGRFMSQYKDLVAVKTTSLNGAGGKKNNAVPKIQACAGVKPGTLGILIMNTDTTAPETASISWGRPAKGAVTIRKLPKDLKIDTPVPVRTLTTFADAAKTSMMVTLGEAEAALLEIPY